MSREKYTQEELRDIALGLYKGSIFISWGLNNDELNTVFLPMLFLSDEDRDNLIKQAPVAFFANAKDASPMAANGLPMFWSMSYLTEEENKIVHSILVGLQNKELWDRQTWFERLQTMMEKSPSRLVSALKSKLNWFVDNLLPK